MLSLHLFLGLPLGLLPSTSLFITAFIGFMSSILVRWPYHRSLISLTFSMMSFTPSSLLMLTLLSLSLKVTPFILLSILISVDSSILSSFLPTVQVSAPYSNTGLITVRYILTFNLLGIFLSLMTPDSSLHLAHAAVTLALTAASVPPLSLKVTPRYLNLSTWFRLVSFLSLMSALVPLLLLTITSVFPVFTFSPLASIPFCQLSSLLSAITAVLSDIIYTLFFVNTINIHE